jgi:hypothetical protein
MTQVQQVSNKLMLQFLHTLPLLPDLAQTLVTDIRARSGQ